MTLLRRWKTPAVAEELFHRDPGSEIHRPLAVDFSAAGGFSFVDSCNFRGGVVYYLHDEISVYHKRKAMAMEKNLRRDPVIGFLDSGIGGLTVLYEARQRCPNARYLYYADTDHVPYGTKSREEIRRYVVDAVTFLVKHGVDILVIACNTATSMAVEELRSRFPLPIIGMEPAVRPAILRYPGARILVCATPATIHGEKLHHLLDVHHADPSATILIPTPRLVTYAEAGEFAPEVIVPYLREVIPPDKYAACVLGCTHFTLFRDSFTACLGSDTVCIDGNTGTVNRMCDVLRENGFTKDADTAQNGCKTDVGGTVRYYLSGREVAEPKTLQFYQTIFDRMAALS